LVKKNTPAKVGVFLLLFLVFGENKYVQLVAVRLSAPGAIVYFFSVHLSYSLEQKAPFVNVIHKSPAQKKG